MKFGVVIRNMGPAATRDTLGACVQAVEEAGFDAAFVVDHLAIPPDQTEGSGGLVAVRDSDYETMVHAPVFPAIERWRDLYHQVASANGGEADAGRYLLSWVTEAGFTEIESTASTTAHTDQEGRTVWGEMWAVRVIDSDFANHAISNGFATRAELQEISDAFRQWAAQPDGFWAWINGEVIGVCPSD